MKASSYSSAAELMEGCFCGYICSLAGSEVIGGGLSSSNFKYFLGVDRFG